MVVFVNISIVNNHCLHTMIMIVTAKGAIIDRTIGLSFIDWQANH